MVKCLSTVRETRVQSLGWEDPLEKEMAVHSSILPGKSHGQRSLIDYSPWGSKESDTTERLHFTFTFQTTKTFELGRNESMTHLNTGESTLSVLEGDQLLEITNDSFLKSMLETILNLHMFWIKLKAEYPETATTGLKSLVPFPTSYIYL